MKAYSIGLYEKAMPNTLTWKEKLEAAKEAGYDFVEISIDETDAKLARLAPSSIGTTIIPAGIFFRNRMIMVFLPPQFVCWGGRGPLPWPFASIPRMIGRSCGPSHQRDLS